MKISRRIHFVNMLTCAKIGASKFSRLFPVTFCYGRKNLKKQLAKKLYLKKSSKYLITLFVIYLWLLSSTSSFVVKIFKL